MNTRKPCRLGHYDCIGIASRDDRCWSDPSRCVRYDNGRPLPRPRHIFEGEDGECIRCLADAPDHRRRAQQGRD